MKSRFVRLGAIVITALGLFASMGNVSAAEAPPIGADTPAILASLPDGSVAQLDDDAAREFRGQALYTMFWGKISWTYTGQNTSAGQWTWNPSNWRYGNWGGINYGSGTPVDSMDGLFKSHDEAYARAGGNSAKERLADAWLLGMLRALPQQKTSPQGAPEAVQYNSGNTKKLMPFSEFARQQAILAFASRILINGYKK